MDNRRIVKIFLASPMDVLSERHTFFQIIERINTTIGRNLQCCYEIISWENNVIPDKGDDAQHVVNLQVSTEYDIFVCIFKDRIGTPTTRSSSGTVEEYERALTYKCTNPDLKLMCYFIGENNNEDIAVLKGKMNSDGVLYSKIKDSAEFDTTLYTHFVQLLLQMAEKFRSPTNRVDSMYSAVAVAFVSQDQQLLLVKRSNSSKYCPGYWQLPGGKIESVETPRKAAVREIDEELHVHIEEDLLKQLNVFNTYFKNDRSRPMQVHLFTYPLDVSTPIVLNSENSDFEWLDITKLDLSDKQLIGINKEMIKAVWNEESILGVWDKILNYCLQTNSNILPQTLPNVQKQSLHSAYAVLSLLGIVEINERFCFSSPYGRKLLEAFVCGYKNSNTLFKNEESDPIQGYRLPISEYDTLRSKREMALFSHKALLSVLSCNIPLPHNTRNVSNVLIFGRYKDDLYLLLRWDLFSKKYQIFASGVDDMTLDSIAMARKTIGKRLAPNADRFFDFLKMKAFETFHFSAGSVDNDPIFRKYIIQAVTGVVRKQYKNDFLDMIKLINNSTLTILKYSLGTSERNLKDLNYFSWCKLNDLINQRTSYNGQTVRGIDELLNNIGETEFSLFVKNAVSLSEEEICDLPKQLL